MLIFTYGGKKQREIHVLFSSWVPGSQSIAMTCSGSLLTCLPIHHWQRWKCICQALGRSKHAPKADAFPVQPHQWLFQVVLYLSSEQPGGMAIPSHTSHSSALTDHGLSPAWVRTILLNLLFCGITRQWQTGVVEHSRTTSFHHFRSSPSSAAPCLPVLTCA